MAQFYKAPSKRSKPQAKGSVKPALVELTISTHDQSGDGLCLSTSPITLVSNALVGEKVRVRVHKANKKVHIGEATQIIEPHPERRAPFCPLFLKCGGCTMQHTSAEFGLRQKSTALQRFLQQHNKLATEKWQPPIQSSITYVNDKPQTTGYRRRIRLAIDARNPQDIKIGYRARNSKRVVDVHACPITVDTINQQLPAINDVLKRLPSISNVGHVIVTAGEKVLDNICKDSNNPEQRATSILQLALFAQKQLSNKSIDILTDFAVSIAAEVVIEVKNAAAIHINSVSSALGMRLGSDLLQKVTPEQFVQVNGSVNQDMITRSLEWLAPKSSDVLYDFFCGSGNFSLAFAAHVKQVVGFEGVDSMVTSASDNAAFNKISNCIFTKADLSDNEQLKQINITAGSFVLLDPSREGADALCEKISNSEAEKVLYISCKPSSFARDMKILEKSFVLEKIAVLDMFPFTQHLELMALFCRK